jgi:hypothetical protein
VKPEKQVSRRNGRKPRPSTRTSHHRRQSQDEDAVNGTGINHSANRRVGRDSLFSSLFSYIILFLPFILFDLFFGLFFLRGFCRLLFGVLLGVLSFAHDVVSLFIAMLEFQLPREQKGRRQHQADKGQV